MNTATANSTQGLRIAISGMHCGSCVNRLEKALLAVPGVDAVAVNLAHEQAQLTLADKFPGQDIADAVSRAGYEASIDSVSLNIDNMTCASCVSRIESALSQLPGVIDVSVNLASGLARVKRFQGSIDDTKLISAVDAAGYRARIQADHNDDSPTLRQPLKRTLDITEGGAVIIAVLLALPLMLPMLVQPLGLHWMAPGWLQWLLATPVQFWLGGRFYLSGWRALKARTGNMDLLVAVGTSAAYGLSVYNLFTTAPATTAVHLYFEASAVVITLILLGKWLESRAKRQTGEAIRALQALRPDRARRRQQGRDEEVPLNQVGPGDILVVRPGESIPTDGRITEGRSHIDEAMISGESLPVSKQSGDAVIGGAINRDGMLLMEVTSVGGETLLAKMIAMVEDAQAAKAPVQRLVDRVSTVFVPAVIAIAGITFAGWLLGGATLETALLNAVAVLVIACPCALGLATPAAIMTGTGVAARHGILIKDVAALETAHRINHVVFDKTGTLTRGELTLQAVICAGGISEEALLGLAAAVQSGSQHPLASAVLAAVSERGIAYPQPTSASGHAGRGAEAQVDGQRILIGNRQWMSEQQLDLSALDAEANTQEEAGLSVSFLVREGRLLGILSFGDTVKDGAQQAIAALQARGVSCTMVTGDNAGSARYFAKQLGISSFRANVLPDEKADFIRQLRKEGEIVAMVGDGINDAPALAAADIGIAMATGTDVAMQSAGITLMRGDPLLVVSAIGISSRSYAKIRQNLFWAFVYNTVGIPLAALGMLSPVLAAAAMALSSVSVLGNALLLRRWRPTK